MNTVFRQHLQFYLITCNFLLMLSCNRTYVDRDFVPAPVLGGIAIDTSFSYSLGKNTPAIFMDADALKTHFQTIFGEVSPRGSAWTEALYIRINKPNVITFNNEYITIDANTFFSPEEKTALGTYNILTSLLSSTSTSRINTKRFNGLTQNYLRSLRAFMADVCEIRIHKDALVLAGSSTEETVIMHQYTEPDLEDINILMSKFFGMPNLEAGFRSAKEYQDVFARELIKLNESEETETGKNKNIESLYKVLCISIGQDPRVFMR